MAINGVFHSPKFVGQFLDVKVKQVSCGQNFTVVLNAKGEVWSFGEAQVGQLGQGRCSKQLQPKITIAKDPVDGAIFSEIACGWSHTLAVTSAGSIYSWGFNEYGQLGLGHKKSVFYPQLVKDVHLSHIFAGGNYSAGISGTIVSFHISEMAS